MWASGGVSVNVIGLPVATLSGKKIVHFSNGQYFN
jgi:hypothetical protein